MTHRFGALLLVVSLGLTTACGPGEEPPGTDGGTQQDAGTQQDGGTPQNRAPTASFSASASAVAGEPVAFDATASSDPDGDALSFSWKFGDGIRGGTPAVAHLFRAAGSYDVELTVTDAHGLSTTATRQITVTEGATPAAEVSATVRVFGPGATPVADASVSVLGGAAAVTTDATGTATLSIGTGTAQTLRIEKAGYLRQTYRAQLQSNATGGQFEIALRPAPAPVVLSDAAAGGTLELVNGARVTLPPSALVDDTGARISGAVEVQIAPVDVVSDPRAFPGSWSGVGPAGNIAPIVSFGATDFTFTQGGKRLDLAADRTAQIELPVFPKLGKDGQPLAAGASIPLWSLDETTGMWVMEGSGTLVASSSSPSGFVHRAQVSHFSWWNCDDFTDTHEVSVDCCLDEDGNGTCDTQVACFVAGNTCAQADCNDPPDAAAPPQSGASASVSAGVPTPLRMPSAFSVKLQAVGPQGLSSGAAIVAGQPNGTTSSLTVVLTAAEAPDPTQLITLPYDQTLPAGAIGEPVQFQFDGTANQKIWASVERVAGSPLTGQLRLLAPGGAELKRAEFNFASGSFVQELPSAGRYTLELTPSGPASGGGYRLRAKDVGSALYVVSVSPAHGETVATPPGTVVITLSAPVKSSSVTTTSVKLFGPSGEISRTGTGTTMTSGNTVTFTPSSPLGNGVPYRVRLTTSLQDTASNPLVGIFESVFRTEDVVGGSATLTSSATASARAMAMAPDGTALLLFANGGQITWTRYLPGEGWSMPERVAPTLTDLHRGPRLAMAANGKAIATWTGTSNGNPPYTHYSAVWDPETGWGPHEAIAYDATDGIDPNTRSVAIDGQGRALTVWKQSNNGPHGWFSRYLPESGWSAPARFDNGLVFGITQDLALNDAGAGAVVFRSAYDFNIARFDPGSGTFEPPTTAGNNQCGVIDVELDDAGNIYALRCTGSDTLFVKYYPAQPVLAETERQLPSGTALNCRPSFAVSRGGKVAVGYCKSGPTPYVDYWPGAGEAWADSFQLSAATGLTTFQLATAGEDFLAAYDVGSTVPANLRRFTAGSWDAEGAAIPGHTIVSDGDVLLASPTGTILYFGAATVGRVQ